MEYDQMDDNQLLEEASKVPETEAVKEEQSEPVEQTENSEVVEPKKFKKPSKNWEEIESNYKAMIGKQSNEVGEYRKKLAELEEKMGKYSPYIDEINKQLELRKNAELQTQMQQNPVEALKKFQEEAIKKAQEEAQKQFLPYQQQLQEVQYQNNAVEFVQSAEQRYGKEVWESAKPEVVEILDVLEQNGNKDLADLLSSKENSDWTMALALGRKQMKAMAQGSTNKQVGQQRVAQTLDVARGVAKPAAPVNRQNKSFEQMTDEELEKLVLSK
jgi:hypothetical protein